MQKCNYCGKTEICEGQPPEGCFLEHQIAKEKELQLEIINAKIFIKEKHKGQMPQKFDAYECAKMMALYVIENTFTENMLPLHRPLSVEEHIREIQRKAHLQ